MLHVFYRVCMIENSKERPEFYSKLSCLRNFLNAFQRVPDASFCLISDGELSPRIRSLVEPIGNIEVLPNMGNSPSFWYALNKAISFPNDDLIYFVEDDYLHCHDALEELVNCRQDIAADYITLYDHPVRYMPEFALGPDLPLNTNEIYISRSHHWRTVESSCMTFASTVRTIREDMPIFELHVQQRRVPADRELFRHLQGLGKYREISPMRKLVGPIPSLATHCETAWFAPVVDWQKVASETA